MNTASFLLTFSLLFFSDFVYSNFETKFEPWGIDQELAVPQGTSNTPMKKDPFSKGCVTCIHFFQNYISPIDGPRSSFYPTSSQYTLEAIQKYGALKGIALGCDRLMRENEEMWMYPIVDKYGHKRKYDPVR